MVYFAAVLIPYQHRASFPHCQLLIIDHYRISQHYLHLSWSGKLTESAVLQCYSARNYGIKSLADISGHSS